MNKRMFITAAAAVGALALAGCSADAEPAPTSAPAPEQASGSGTEIVVWTDAEREDALREAAKAFEADTGAKITLVQKNFEDLRNDFITQVPTGEGPDITVGAHDWLGALVTAGVVDTIDLGEKTNDFENVAVEAMTYDGQLYALPYSVESVALVQNADLVGEEIPATWDELVERGLEVSERPIAVNTQGEKGDGYTMYGFQTSFGAPLFTQDETGSYSSDVAMGGSNGEAFAQWLGDNSPSGTGYLSTTIDYDINNELFNSGETPFTIQGPWALASYTDVDNIVVGPIPSAGGEPAAPLVGVQGFYLSSQSKNALLAQEFLVGYLSTEDAQRTLYEADPRIPALTSLAEEVASDPIVAGFLAASQNGVPMPSIPEMGDVWDLWNGAEVQILNGADPASTWNTMVSNLEATIN